MPRSSEAESHSQTLQFLGLAFAGADLVFEIEPSGSVTFALGAVTSLTGLSNDDMLKARWTDLVAPADSGYLATLLQDLGDGERRGPFQITLSGGPGARPQRRALLSLFRLPQNGGRTSCAISLAGGGSEDRTPRDRHGLVPKAAFEQVAADALEQAERDGTAARLEMVEVPGLAAAVVNMEADVAEHTLTVLAGLLRAASYGGVGAAEVATDRFALVSTGPAPTDTLARRLQDASGQPLKAVAASVPTTAGSVEAKLKTIRYVLDRYIEFGAEAASTDFKTMVEGAARASARFRVAVGSGAFRLAYQPIVSIDGDRLHHFEALARFDDERSPAETIRMAEELGLIFDFDLAVVKLVAKALANAGAEVKIAANISGISLTAPGFIEAFARTVTGSGVSPSRLLLEITETARIHDIPEASKRIAALRKRGHPVCLDDFGAGAASMEYLAAFEFDFIKIDGAYVKALTVDSREALLIRHMTSLCKDLGAVAIAEMIEIRDTAHVLKALGVTLGQGWTFGKPEAQPKWTPPTPPAAPAARRKGAVESWG
jgi:EAL domain-containing protein (putative c-di-GMP-specific phosphodiesterase class I)